MYKIKDTTKRVYNMTNDYKSIDENMIKMYCVDDDQKML